MSASSAGAAARRSALTPHAAERLRSEHTVIAGALADLRLLAGTLPDLPHADRTDLIRVTTGLLARFQEHALIEERDVYPAVTDILGTPCLEAAMTYDHRAVEVAAAELPGIDPLDISRLQALLYGLDTLVVAHMQKEAEIIFPMLNPPRIANLNDVR